MNESGIKSTLYNWLSSELGKRHVFTITFDADLVSGNLIDGSFDGDAIDQVAFSVDHDTTMLALAAEIQKSAEIFKAVVTAARVITVTGANVGDEITVVGPTVTAGASQAVATIATTTTAESVVCIFENQVDDTGRNAPRPSNYPYATIKIDSIVQLGHDEVREIDSVSNIATIGGQRRATININYFGSNAFENIMKAFNSLEKQTLIDTFSAAGIAYLEKNNVQNLTEFLETRFEERSYFDFMIGFAENIEDDLGIIESVELTGTVTADGKDPTVDSVTVGPTTISV